MKKYLFTLIAFSFLAGASCQQKIDNEKEMKVMADKSLEVWNTGNLSLFDEILSPDYVYHQVDISEDVVGIEANKELVASFRTAFPDLNVTFDELIFNGDNGVMRWTVTGTNTGPYGGLPPTGKKVKYSGVAISHVVDGKSVETWQYYNQAALLIQLGYTISPPEE
jgi:steroid delta-isomerase-like uncharacterized protein